MQKFEKLRQLRSVSCEGPEMRRKHQPAAEAALLEAAREAEEDAAGHRPSAAQKQQQIADKIGKGAVHDRRALERKTCRRATERVSRVNKQRRRTGTRTAKRTARAGET